MRTNAIFRKITQSLALEAQQIQELFAMSSVELDEKDIANLLKADYQSGFEQMPDYLLHVFLNKLIDQQRGKKTDNDEPVNKHKKITNNDVLKKLRIAFNLHEQHVREVFQLATIELSKSDLSALFRKADNSQFNACDDELLLDFIEGLGKWVKKKSERGI